MEKEEQEILNEQKEAEAKREKAMKILLDRENNRKKGGRLTSLIFLALGVALLSAALYFFV